MTMTVEQHTARTGVERERCASLPLLFDEFLEEDGCGRHDARLPLRLTPEEGWRVVSDR